jgi:hypothetical protein
MYIGIWFEVRKEFNMSFQCVYIGSVLGYPFSGNTEERTQYFIYAQCINLNWVRCMKFLRSAWYE